MLPPAGVLLAALANLSISFNVVNVSLALKALTAVRPEVSDAQVSLVSAAVIAGMMLGQLVFGGLGDSLGRRQALTLTLLMCALGAIGSACLVYATATGPSIGLQLTMWRFLLGIGAGGVYPLSAVIAKESVTQRQYSTVALLPTALAAAAAVWTESTAVAFVFSMQGFGYLASPVVMSLLLALPLRTALVWRLQLGLGALPVLLAAAVAVRTKAATAVVNAHSDTGCADAPPIRRSDISVFKLVQEHKWLLVGTAGVWLLFDITFYGNTLFTPEILAILTTGSDSQSLAVQAHQDLILKLLALPGYIAAVLFVRAIGVKRLQMIGLFVMVAAYVIIGLLFKSLPRHPYVAILLYSLTFIFSNFGPNPSTFMLPSLTYERHARSTLSGVSAACGKLGALIGILAFKPLSRTTGIGPVLIICAAISCVALLITQLFVQPDAASDADSDDLRDEFDVHSSNSEVQLTDGPLAAAQSADIDVSSDDCTQQLTEGLITSDAHSSAKQQQQHAEVT